MPDQHVLMLVLTYDVRLDKSLASTAELIAWDAFRRACEALTLAAVQRVRAARGAIDDIVQDVWTTVLEDLPRFCLDPNHKTFEDWVTSIASHIAWNYVRRPARRHERPLPADHEALLLDEQPGPEAELEQMQQHEQFHACVAQFAERLSKRNGSVLTRRFIEQMTPTAIAHELGVTPNYVRKLLKRIVPELRDCLRADGLYAN